jgi:hypothetical protein
MSVPMRSMKTRSARQPGYRLQARNDGRAHRGSAPSPPASAGSRGRRPATITIELPGSPRSWSTPRRIISVFASVVRTPRNRADEHRRRRAGTRRRAAAATN